MRRLIFAGLAVLFAVVLVKSDARAEAQAVRVTGYGETVSDARLDAIAQAMQEVTKQLMVTDRIIENDEIIMDKVISTMDGFVENFTVLREEKISIGHRVEAEVTVSRSGIASYIGEIQGARAGVDGSSMFAEAQRQAAAEESNGQLYDRLFRGFPMKAMKVEIQDVEYDGENETVVITISYGIAPGFIEQMKSGMRELADIQCQFDISRLTGPKGLGGEMVMFQAVAIARFLESTHSPLDGYCEDRNRQPVTSFDLTNAVCFADGTSALCMLPRPGRYCSFCDQFPSMRLMMEMGGMNQSMTPIYFAVIPRDGRGDMTANKCILIDGYANLKFGNRIESAEMPAARSEEADLLLFKEGMQKAFIAVSRDDFDMARTKSVDVVPFYAIQPRFNHDPKWTLVDVFEDRVPIASTCSIAARMANR